jgi:hypothetical protein
MISQSEKSKGELATMRAWSTQRRARFGRISHNSKMLTLIVYLRLQLVRNENKSALLPLQSLTLSKQHFQLPQQLP